MYVFMWLFKFSHIIEQKMVPEDDNLKSSSVFT